ncbi:hypothetical protein WCE10_12945 [Cronobacter muytjensii]|uniref:MrpH family fimbial adhesin n=1 Tax=Cronobacter muytjensii TaxID=413501 RepID=UPI0034D72833
MKRILFLIVLLATHYSIASPYPVITSVAPIPAQQHRYAITQALMDIGPAGDVVPPAGFYMELVAKTQNEGFPAQATQMTFGSSSAFIRTDGIKTASELGVESYNAGGKDINIVVSPAQTKCVAYAVGPYPQYSPWESITLYAGCTAVPPADEWCKITTPELLLDHGTITLRQSEGNSASQQMAVDCTTTMAVRFDLITADKYVYLTPSGKTEIKVNDMPVGSKISLNQGANKVKVSDSLSGLASEGAYTGSSVLVMMPY